MYLVLRIIGTFLSIGHFLGFLMYWSTSEKAAMGIPSALLFLSLAPSTKLKARPSLLIIIVIFVIVSYALAGVPFLNTRDDFVARLLHLSELVIIIVFVLRAAIMAIRDGTNKKVKQ